MAWRPVLATVVYYIVSPVLGVVFFLSTLTSTLLSPLTHLLSYIMYAALLPLRLLARLETLYVYLGVAVLVGLASGTLLHLSSGTLVAALDLRARPGEDEAPRSTYSSSIDARRARRAAVRAKRQQAGDLPSPGSPEGLRHGGLDVGLKREYADWLDKDRGRKREGLLGQTILEEEDDASDYYDL
ncbi:MAG: hypothetical protein M1832_005818 [Thelocarpon impressellum]|nr:MAG: hypothetical protein M1832_005818 [Thelocarpon impressellum]